MFWWLRRLWWRITGNGLVFLAGFALIAVGVACLYLSDRVVTGWWQGTLDAFGVGFIIGGLVDVLAITALNERAEERRQRVAAQHRQVEINQEAQQILRNAPGPGEEGPGPADKTAEQARSLLLRGGSDIDPELRERLQHLIDLDSLT